MAHIDLRLITNYLTFPVPCTSLKSHSLHSANPVILSFGKCILNNNRIIFCLSFELSIKHYSSFSEMNGALKAETSNKALFGFRLFCLAFVTLTPNFLLFAYTSTDIHFYNQTRSTMVNNLKHYGTSSIQRKLQAIG